VAIEIEDKFDVPLDYELPEQVNLPCGTEVVGPKTHQLVALYFDTPDLRLAARGITLRRRRGGSDPGWHLKLPRAKGVRQEITRPLTRSAKIVPPELVDLALAYTRGAPLAPVAELDTRRTVTTLVNAAGVRLVEIADDQVKGTVFNEGKHVERWREVEAELIEGEEKLLKKVGKQLTKAGASPSESANKLLRLLNAAGPVPEQPRARTKSGSAGEVVVDYVFSQVSALLSQDPRVRRAEEDAVHQMRVASRRLRSVLKSFKTIVEGTENVQDELKWLGEVLGEARDLEVIRERFTHRLDDLDPALIVGPIRNRLSSDLLDEEHEAYDRIREALGGERYFALLDALDDLVGTPVLTKAAKKPADALDVIAAKSWRRVVRAYEAAQAVEDLAERELAMHEVRKTAKRARYTAEALGKKELAKRAEDVQEVLGTHRDGVVAQERLTAEAETARLAGEDTFTYGVLTGVERAEAERANDEFPRVWAETTAAVAKLA
jgi:CHAD domain-containing protein